MTNLSLLFCFVLLRSSEGKFALKCPILDTISLASVELTSIYPIGIDTMYVLTGIYKTFPQKHLIRGTQREYSSKPLKRSIVKRVLVFKR